MNAIERYENALKSGERLTKAEFSKLWKAAYDQHNGRKTPRIAWYILGASVVISLLQAIR